MGSQWTVNELIPYKIKQYLHEQLEHWKDIHFDTSSTDVSLLIGVDTPELHLPNEIRKGNKKKSIELNQDLLGFYSEGITRKNFIEEQSNFCLRK